MSVFSKLKASRKAAKEHKAKVDQKEEKAAVAAKYRHVPTHAAVDALSGAPSGWKHQDRSKIQEHHKRRSAMASRTNSYISTTSFAHSAAGPSNGAPPFNRNSSYNSYNPTWFDRGGDVGYTNEPSQKRYKSSRGHSYQDSGVGHSIGPSPLASNVQSEGTSLRPGSRSTVQTKRNNGLNSYVEVSPAHSSGHSTTSSSSENLEMKQSNRAKADNRPKMEERQPSYVSNRAQPIVFAEQDVFDRLHTSKDRKLGEAPILAVAPQRAALVHAGAPATEAPVKAKKARWSLLGKRKSAAVAA